MPYSEADVWIDALQSITNRVSPYINAAALGTTATMFNMYRPRNTNTRGNLRGTVQKTIAVGPSDINSARIYNMQKQLAKISPNIENVSIAPSSLTVTANTVTAFDYGLSAGLVTSTEMGAKYIGDKYRNKSLLMRMYFHEALNCARVVVYVPKVAGTTYTIPDFLSIPDPTVYTVLYDTMLFPAHAAQPRKNFLLKRLNLKDRITINDRQGAATGSIKSGDIRIAILAENATATNRTISCWYNLKFQNK